VKPDISAPGDGILSAVPGGYDIMSGTSMATPHITGAVAVLRSIDPGLTVDQLESMLMFGAKDLEDPGPDNSSGAGRLDLFVSAQIAILGPETPVVKVLATDAVATEAGPTSGLFSVIRAGNTDSDLRVLFSIGGTAASGSDYESIGGSVTIPAGRESADIPVTAIDDLLAELPETVILTISPDPAYIVSASNSAVVTIQSDELLSDLAISSLTGPAAGAGAGDSIVLTETTRNQGGGAADPSTTRFYLSANSIRDGSDIPLGGRSVAGLAAGATSSGSTTVVLPQQTAAGTWYVIAEADAEGVVIESSESNNTLAKTIKIGPDLDVTTTTAPATAGAGQSIAVSDTIVNVGGGAAAASLTQFFLSVNSTLDASDTLVGARVVGALAPGTSGSGSTTVTIPDETIAGIWYLIAKADGEDAVPETSESNNTLARSIRIGPDLAISTMTAPANAGAGQTITITDTTKNQGGGAAPASRTQFYLSKNSIPDAADTLLGGRSVVGLEAGATSSGSTTVSIPDGTAVGAWFIIAKADAETVVAETSETNNSTVKSIGVGPDLIVSAITAPTASGPGQTIDVTDTTKNQGGGAAEDSQTQLYLSTNSILDAADTLLGSRSVASLAAGTASAGSTSVTIPEGTSVGTWYILIKADAQGVVTETTESNNTMARSIKMGPDLLVTAISAPSIAGAGQTIAVTDTTKNQGGGAAEASRTQIYLSKNTALDASDTLLGARDLGLLAAGESGVGAASVAIPPGTATGTWYLIAKADGEGVVPETTETNNAYPATITIGPDLDITAMSAPSTAAAGQAIAITDTVKNLGGGAADASQTYFYLSRNTTLDATDIPLGARNVGELAAGASGSGSTSVVIPSGTAAGTWYIISVADGAGAVAETSESNNTFIKALRVT
jgi:subtilase family serine protease